MRPMVLQFRAMAWTTDDTSDLEDCNEYPVEVVKTEHKGGETYWFTVEVTGDDLEEMMRWTGTEAWRVDGYDD